MGKLSFGRVLLDRFCLSSGAGINSCLCFNQDCTNRRDIDRLETKPLIITAKEEGEGGGAGQLMRLKDVISGPPTLALQLKPKIVVLKVSMHCNGCARKVEKHISKMEGVISYQVDLETKMVIITGDIVPFEVLESVSKVKTAELWNSSIFNPTQNKLTLL